MPRHEHQVRVAYFVACKEFCSGVLEVTVDYREDTFDLVAVPREDGLGFLLGVEDEPGALAEVGALAGGLEVGPAFLGPLLLSLLRMQTIGSVVCLEQVVDTGTGFPDCGICVWVLESGDTTIGVDLLKGFLLQVWEVHDFCVVGDGEGVEDYGYFPGVGTLRRGVNWRDVGGVVVRTHAGMRVERQFLWSHDCCKLLLLEEVLYRVLLPLDHESGSYGGIKS